MSYERLRNHETTPFFVLGEIVDKDELETTKFAVQNPKPEGNNDRHPVCVDFGS